MRTFTVILLAGLLGIAIADGKGKKWEKLKKTWDLCTTETGCKPEMFAPLKEASGTFSEDEPTKKCVFCLMTKMEMATEGGGINKEKCEKFSGNFLSRKREEKKEGLVACCKNTEGAAPVDSVFNVLKCWKKAVEPEAVFAQR